MNGKQLKNWGLALIVMTMSSIVNAQSPFEGFISFDWTKNNEKTTYKYYVKGENVRVEEINKEGAVEGIMLVNTRAGEAIALDPRQKLFMTVKNNAMAKVPVEVQKQRGTKDLHGYKCEEYNLVNSDLDRQCHYYLAKGGFDFFVPLLRTLKRKENLVLFYMSVPEAEGSFPMIGEEKDMAGNVIMRLEVTKVTPATIDVAMFHRPPEYTEFKKE